MASSRAIRLRVCPPIDVKLPLTKILPSACTIRLLTPPFAFGSNESAKPVVPSNRAMLLRVCPPMLVKLPPTKILPSACTANTETPPVGFGLNAVSSVPSGFNRAIELRGWPPTKLKVPAIKIFPSGWRAMTETASPWNWLATFGLKPSSADCARIAAVPVASSAAIENRIERSSLSK